MWSQPDLIENCCAACHGINLLCRKVLSHSHPLAGGRVPGPVRGQVWCQQVGGEAGLSTSLSIPIKWPLRAKLVH